MPPTKLEKAADELGRKLLGTIEKNAGMKIPKKDETFEDLLKQRVKDKSAT